MPHFRSNVNGATTTVVADENPDPSLYEEVEADVVPVSAPVEENKEDGDAGDTPADDEGSNDEETHQS